MKDKKSGTTRATKLRKKRLAEGMKPVSVWSDKEATVKLEELKLRYPNATKDQLVSACIKFTANASEEEIRFVTGLTPTEDENV